MRHSGKHFLSLSLITQILLFSFIFFSFNPALFSLPNKSSAVTASVLEENYSEFSIQGEKLKRQGQFKKSIESFKRALLTATNQNDSKNKLESLLELGILYWNIGEYDKSLEFYQKAFLTAEELGLKERMDEIFNYWQIYRLYNEAKEYRSQGQYQNSIMKFEEAIQLARKTKSEEHEVKCLRQLSVTYADLNEMDKLFSLNRKALEIAQKLNHQKEEGRCLYNIGLYYGTQENYSQALWHYERALRIARKLSVHIDQSNCLANISDIYIQLGNYDKALEYLKEVVRIDRQLGEEAYVAMDLNNMGVIYQKKALHSDSTADLHEALTHFKESLHLARKIGDTITETQTLNNIGMVYKDLERYPEALAYFQLGLKKAEKAQESEEIANILVNIGVVYSLQRNYESSIRSYQKAIDIASGIKGENILWEAHFEKANAYFKLGKYQKSLENYKNAISVLEKIRSRIQLEELKASYLGTDKRIETYQNIVDLLWELHASEPEKLYDLEAFDYLEKAKARAFLDRLEVSRVNISHGVAPALLQKEEALMKRISTLNSKLFLSGLAEEQRKEIEDQLKTCEERLEALKREIRISSPAYADLKYPQIISLEQAQKHILDSKTAFFEYCLGKRNSYAFVITKTELNIFPLPPAEQIREQVKAYLKVISEKENQDFQLGYELFCALVLPGLEKKIHKLIFIPDDILHYLPFETLLSQKNEKRWLVQDYKIGYAPSISALQEIIEHESLRDSKSQKDLLAFGDPFFGPDEEIDKARDKPKVLNASNSNTLNFLRLKYSGLEIEKMAALFKKSNISIFKRNQATEERLKRLNLTDYKILHFATHCLIDDEKPARSSIVLSLGNSSAEDGLLQMREIFDLKLNSDLVTLSACQTGLGQFIKGEGIEGLSRAFFYAGASSALISLWAVHDQASSQFMERYYFHLRSSNSIMDSLQKAKLEMIGSDVFSHPYYWAGFIVTGNSDKVIYLSAAKALILKISLLLLGGGIVALILLKKPFRARSSVF